MSDDVYKKLYFDLKKQFDRFLKHRRLDVKKCKYCREWYAETMEEVKKVKNKKLRESLTEMFETLWLNNALDWDIMAHTFKAK